MLISETEYRYQVEEDIKPFRDVLLGLFFITIGMLLNVRLVFEQFGWVMLALLVPTTFKFFLMLAARRAGSARRPAWRSAPRCRSRRPANSASCCSTRRAGLALLPPDMIQIVLAAMLLSMLATPFLDAVQRPHRDALRGLRVDGGLAQPDPGRRARAHRPRST